MNLYPSMRSYLYIISMRSYLNYFVAKVLYHTRNIDSYVTIKHINTFVLIMFQIKHISFFCVAILTRNMVECFAKIVIKTYVLKQINFQDEMIPLFPQRETLSSKSVKIYIILSSHLQAFIFLGKLQHNTKKNANIKIY